MIINDANMSIIDISDIYSKGRFMRPRQQVAIPTKRSRRRANIPATSARGNLAGTVGWNCVNRFLDEALVPDL
jgi:hypothetical protein